MSQALQRSQGRIPNSNVFITVLEAADEQEQQELFQQKIKELITRYGAVNNIPTNINFEITGSGAPSVSGGGGFSLTEPIEAKDKSFSERFTDSLVAGARDYSRTIKNIDDFGYGTDQEIESALKAERQAELEDEIKYGKRTSFQDLIDAYNSPNRDDLAKSFGGTLIDYAGENIAYSLPAMGTIAAGAAVGSFLPGVGTLVGAAIGATLVALPYFFGQNLERQVETLDEQGLDLTDGNINTTGAFFTGLAQGATESILFLLFGGMGGTPAKMVAGELRKNLAIGAKEIAKTTAISAPVEATTEITQQLLERLQAGLPISPSDEAALREYIESGAAGFITGPAVTGPLETVRQTSRGITAQPSQEQVKNNYNEKIQELQEQLNKHSKNEPLDPNSAEYEQWNNTKEKIEEVLLSVQTSLKSFEEGTIVEKRRQEKAEKGEDINKEKQFEFDLPEAPYKFDDPTIKETEIKNSVMAVPEVVPFSNLPGDAKVRLFFGREEVVKDETGKIVFDEDGEAITEIINLKDKDGFNVYKDYMVEEFIDTPDGKVDKAEPNERLFSQMQIEHEGKTYQPFWKKGTLSFAEIQMSKEPLFRVSSDNKPSHNKIKPLLLPSKPKLRKLAERLGIKYTDKTLDEQQEARAWLNHITARGARFFTPQRGVPIISWSELMRKRWFTREQLEKAKGLSKRVNLGIKTAEKNKKSILNTLEQSVDGLGLGKELYASYLSNTPFGNIKVTPKLLEEYGFDRNTIAAMIKMRRLIDQNSREIESLIRELDPEAEIWSEELRETIRNRLGAYITKSYEINVNPEYIKNDLFTLTFNRPNGALASKEQKRKHLSAKKILSEDLFKKGRVSSKLEADKKAEEMLNNLYDRQLSAQQLTEAMEMDSSTRKADAQEVEIDISDDILKARQELKPEIEELLGIIKDPNINDVITAFKQTEFISGVKYINDLFNIANDPNNRLISPVKDGRFNVKITGNEVSNPFVGYYTIPEFASALNDVFSGGVLSDTTLADRTPLGSNRGAKFILDKIYAPYFLRGKVLINFGKIVISPATQARNFISAAAFAIVNGNIRLNPKDNYNNLKSAFRNAGSYFKGMTTKQAQRMIGLGVLNTSANLGDLIRGFELASTTDTIGGVVASVNSQQKNILKRLTRKTIDTAQRAYQFGDDFWKAYSFVTELQKFKDIFGFDSFKDRHEALTKQVTEGLQKGKNDFVEIDVELQKLENDLKQIEEVVLKTLMPKYVPKLKQRKGPARLEELLEELAAYRVRQNVPNYDFVGSFTDILRGSPLSNFTAFPTEIIRTSINTYQSGVNEFKAGQELKKLGRDQESGGQGFVNIGTKLGGRGAARVLSLGGYGALAAGSSVFALLMLGYDPEDIPEAEFGLSEFMAPYAKDDKRIITGINKKGEVFYNNNSYIEAYDLLAEPVRIFVRNIYEEKYKDDPKYVKRSLDGMLEAVNKVFGTESAYLQRSILTQIILDVSQNLKGDSVKAGTPRTITDAEGMQAAFDKVIYALEEAAPGVYNYFKNIDTLTEGDKYDKYGRKIQKTDTVKQLFGIKTGVINLNDNMAVWGINNFFDKRQDANSAYYIPSIEGGEELLTVSDIVEGYRKANIKYYEEVKRFRNKIEKANGVNPWVTDVTIRQEIDKRKKGLRFKNEDKKNIFGRPNEEGVIPFKPLPMKDYYTEVKKQYLDRYERDGMTEKYQELIRVNFPKDALKEQKEIFETLSFPVYNFKEPPEGEEVGF